MVARESSAHPARAIDALMAAIYHRFIMLSGDFTQAGPGVVLNAHQGVEELNVTVDFGSLTLPPAQRPPALTLYPVDGHRGVPTDFDPAEEYPNPMPGHTLVGYPMSVQVDSRSHARGGLVRALRGLVGAIGAGPRCETAHARGRRRNTAPCRGPDSDFAFGAGHGIPAAILGIRRRKSGVANLAIHHGPGMGVVIAFASPTVTPGGSQSGRLVGMDPERGAYYLCYAPARLVRSLEHRSETEFTMAITDECGQGQSCAGDRPGHLPLCLLGSVCRGLFHAFLNKG